MVKRIVNKSEYKEIEVAYTREGVQHYHLNILISENENEDECVVLSHIYDHEPTQEDKEKLYADYLALCKRVKIEEVERYDKSADVNGFYIGEQFAWLDKATRVGLANSIAIEKASGKKETTLYLNGIALTIEINKAQEMLAALELYALECYRKTEEHKAIISSITDIESVENYDYKQGYPTLLHLS